MGFNFGGAMRGLGAGLVSSGALLEKFNERKFEEEQLKVKLDREEHMARLAREAQSIENQKTRDQQGDQFNKEIGLKESQFNKEIGMKESQFNQEIAIKKADVESANAARAQQLSIQQQELSMKRQAYADASPEAQKKQRQESADALTELGFDKKSVGAFIVTGKLPDSKGNEIKVAGYDIVATQKAAGEEFDSLDEEDQKNAARTFGVKSPVEAKRIYKANAVADLFALSGKSDGTAGALQEKATSTEKYNMSQLVKDATEGSGRAKTIAIEKITAAALSPLYKDDQRVQQAYQLIKTANTPTEVNRDPSQFRTSGTSFSE